MEIVQSGQMGGFIRVTAITTTPVDIDLSAFEGRYVKISVDQRAFIGWKPTSDTSTMTLPLADKAASLGTVNTVGSVYPDPVASGDQGVQRFVRPGMSTLVIAARSTNITELLVKVTSPKTDI